MFRFRVHFDGPTPSVQYGVPQATALASGFMPRSLFFASENRIYHTTLPVFDDSVLSTDNRESPVTTIEGEEMTSISKPIQCICSARRDDCSLSYIGVIDNQGSIYIYEDRGDNRLSLFRTFQHESTNTFGLEESWGVLSFSPSGKRVFSLHGLTDSVCIFDLDIPDKRTTFFTSGHPYSACWRDEETIVVAENKQLSQFYAMAGRECTSFSRITVGTNNVRVVLSFNEGDTVIACTENDHGVFGLNSRSLKIVSRWKAPIRSMVVGGVTETIQCASLGGKVNVAYFCGDDNEVLMYNCSGKEGKDSALKERHTINIRSRSRIIGLALGKEGSQSCLFVLGQNGDLDAIVNPCEYMIERRKRKREEGMDDEIKTAENDD